MQQYPIPPATLAVLQPLIRLAALRKLSVTPSSAGYQQRILAVDLPEFETDSDSIITAETLTKPQLPLHVDTGHRTAHCVLNCSIHDLIIQYPDTPGIALAANHWFVLNSAELHGASCTHIPHTVVCVDKRMGYGELTAWAEQKFGVCAAGRFAPNGGRRAD